jgi:hypothetical protein
LQENQCGGEGSAKCEKFRKHRPGEMGKYDLQMEEPITSGGYSIMAPPADAGLKELNHPCYEWP